MDDTNDHQTERNAMKEHIDLPEWIFFGIAGITAFLVLLIIGFLIYAAAPVLKTSGIGFITSPVWNYDTHQYGVLIYLIDTLILTALTLAIAVPSGLLTAMYLAEWAPAWMEKILRPLVELLVGIPSVVYGLFGLLVLSNFFIDYLNPFVDHLLGFMPVFRNVHPDFHMSLLLTATILAVMVIPTIVALSQDAMRGVPDEYREASVALGATRWETVRYVVIPAAFPGIVTAVVLAMMRAMGETMAVVMLMGNSPQIPSSVFDTGETMTAKVLNDILWNIGDPEPMAALFGIAVAILLMEILAVAGVRLICSWAQKRSQS
ncbi:phosphate ABC transporter permease subunit PstC [Methanoregula sp.]|uniref:phosphate ABC transporter permease subunit PstC n=1 Tax=Methanoregula sp. TaxID=2052170 RepID=UPI003C789C9C